MGKHIVSKYPYVLERIVGNYYRIYQWISSKPITKREFFSENEVHAIKKFDEFIDTLIMNMEDN